MASRWIAFAFAFAPLAGFAGGCGGSDDPTLADYVDDVSSADGSVHAAFVRGELPAAGAGPTLALSTNAAVIPGGTTPAAVIGDLAFTRIVIAIDGVDGYYAIDLPAPTTTLDLVVTLSQGLDLPSFDWIWAIGDAGGYGAYTITPVSVINVGTGDVQISLSWNSAADVDLHVVDPSGEEIWYGSRESASGGMLDLDSNAGCGSDGPRNENITWPVHGAPSGTYHVLVDYWSACDATSTDFTVAVNARGMAPQTMTGTFTGDGDRGGPGAGMEVTTLTVDGAAPSAARSGYLGSFPVELAPGAIAHAK